jgi:N-acetylglucosamine kinase-like BadF-type ATPase
LKTYIGIEGGGTRTRVLVQAGDNPPSYYERAVSLKVRDGGYAASAQSLSRLLAEDIGIAATELSHASLALGLSGMSRESDQSQLASALHALPAFRTTRLHIETDATLTMKSVLSDERSGILLIAGTGSVIYYQRAGGGAHRIGGWGPVLSDEGSGYRLGLRTLRWYVHVLDGLLPRDSFFETVSARITAVKIDSEDRFAITRLTEQDPAFVAGLAKDLLDAAYLKDAASIADAASDEESAQDVLREEMIELILMLQPLLSEEVMGCAAPYALYLSGSVAKHAATMDMLNFGLNGMDEARVRLIPIDDVLPCMKALEIARNNSK